MIYYVEDDASIRNLIVYTLGVTGFKAKGFDCSAPFWEEMQKKLPELILLDIMLPGESGVSILRRLRSDPDTRHIPIIMLTAKDGEDDVVEGLDFGADDYIAKPCGMMELIARIKALLRRTRGEEAQEIISAGGIHMDTARHTVRTGDGEIALTLKEYEILRVLMESAGRLVDRNKLINAVWSSDYAGADHTLDTHIRTLRSKLGSYGSQIHTVYGCGYRFKAAEDSK